MPENNDERRECDCPRVKHEHGTRSSYVTCKCRCDECREAARKDARQYEKQIAYGRSKAHQVDAEPARKHLKRLLRRGWGIRLVAQETGVGVSTLQRVLYGHPSKGVKVAKTVKAESSEKILGFTPIARRKGYAGTKVELTDATGSRRRLQGLMVQGFSVPLLAKISGKSSSTLQKAFSVDALRVETAEAICRLYDDLWDKAAPETTAREKTSVTLAKRHAAANGWLPPMAWDDDRIDDPKYNADPKYKAAA